MSTDVPPQEGAIISNGDLRLAQSDPREALMKRVANDFSAHALDEAGARELMSLRLAFRSVAQQVVELCPVGREQATTLTLLEQASMMANAAIARKYPAVSDSASIKVHKNHV